MVGGHVFTCENKIVDTGGMTHVRNREKKNNTLSTIKKCNPFNANGIRRNERCLSIEVWIFKVILQNVIALRGDFNGSLNLEMKNRIQLDSRGLIEKV